jgi:hypothetical protein
MRGNSHVRFLEGWAGAIPPGHSTRFCFMVWRDTGASARAPAGATAKRRPPGRGGVEKERQSPPLIGQLNFRLVIWAQKTHTAWWEIRAVESEGTFMLCE